MLIALTDDADAEPVINEPDPAALLTDDEADHLAGLLTQAAGQAKTWRRCWRRPRMMPTAWLRCSATTGSTTGSTIARRAQLSRPRDSGELNPSAATPRRGRRRGARREPACMRVADNRCTQRLSSRADQLMVAVISGVVTPSPPDRVEVRGCS